MVRPAEPRDAAAIAAIYNQGIEERQATFETRPRSSEDFREALGGGPGAARVFLAAVESERLVGWARLSPYGERECYAGVAEASVYVDIASRGRGIGRRLLEALAEEAERLEHWKLIGLLFATNRASIALCRAAGCREVGTLRRHGRLDGQWRDIVLVERLLGPAVAGFAAGGGTAQSEPGQAPPRDRSSPAS